jgi:tetratricopeptide (TPR) repeat protein
MSKKLVLIIPILLLLGTTALLLFNTSYQKSIYANYLLFEEDYDEALRVARESYTLDPYNKMAKSVMTKASAHKAYSTYVKLASEYLDKIVQIANQSPITPAQRVEAKLMSEVAIDRYEILTKTHYIEGELKDRAKKLYEKFKEIYKNAF